MAQISIVHWNDVYRVTPRKVSPNGDKVDVTHFAALLDDIRSNWALRPDGTRDGLSLFSGDVFSPSVESAVTRGSHMVPVMNELAPDVAMTGNHEFDFGYPHLAELVQDAKFPWLLSNIIDERTNNVPEHLHLFKVLERSGVKIGIIGLAEEDWIGTIASWPSNFKFRDMAETGRNLSQQLRGEYQCDIIIALTHARVPNDIKLAKDLLVLSPSAQKNRSIAGEHGVDIIMGGHDHLYFVSKGVTTWEGYDVTQPSVGSEGDNGDILVVKSGTDFKELSELTLELEDTPPGSVRKKVIKAVHGKRHQLKPGMPSSPNLQRIIQDVLSSVTESLNAPVCVTEVELNLKSHLIRTEETVAGNWFADVLRHAYDDALISTYRCGSDGAFITAGTLRGDSQYPPGVVTLGNILEILPFDDPIVVLELDGATLWEALEEGLSKYPAQEGRFPIVSGLRVSWDSRLPPGKRVLGVWLSQEMARSPLESPITDFFSTAPAHMDGEPIERKKDGRKYKIVTREYLASGHDGYTAIPGHKYLIDDEHGQPMSSLVRKYLLGAHYVNKMVRLREMNHETDHLHSHSGTADVVKREVEHRKRRHSVVAHRRHHGAAHAHHKLRSRAHYVDHFNISAREHMGHVDHYDGKKIRQGVKRSEGNDERGPGKTSKEDLLVIHPTVDGRLKDVARN